VKSWRVRRCFGEHTDLVLAELGYDAAAIAALRQGGII
jgi:crotonobetainyl-CoA:carnitine CoA-transferase CaiB-like acyl-CoA transferase